MERREEEDESELTRRVQSALGEELEIMGSEVTTEDVNKWMSGIRECGLKEVRECAHSLLSPLRDSKITFTLFSSHSYTYL